MMSEKRFDTNGYYINDTFSDGRKWLVNEVEAKEIVDVMNNLDMKARERSKALSKLQKKVNEQQAIIEAKDSLLSILSKENEKLRFLIDINSVSERKKLERQVDEQQATIDKLRVDIRATRTTIRKLQDLCGESDGQNAKLRIENKKLKEENEQLKNRLNSDL